MTISVEPSWDIKEQIITSAVKNHHVAPIDLEDDEKWKKKLTACLSHKSNFNNIQEVSEKIFDMIENITKGLELSEGICLDKCATIVSLNNLTPIKSLDSENIIKEYIDSAGSDGGLRTHMDLTLRSCLIASFIRLLFKKNVLKFHNDPAEGLISDLNKSKDPKFLSKAQKLKQDPLSEYLEKDENKDYLLRYWSVLKALSGDCMSIIRIDVMRTVGALFEIEDSLEVYTRGTKMGTKTRLRDVIIEMFKSIYNGNQIKSVDRVPRKRKAEQDNLNENKTQKADTANVENSDPNIGF